MFKKFILFNRRVSFAITPSHISEIEGHRVFLKEATIAFSQPDVKTVLDVGAGKTWPFPASFKKDYGIFLIGIDIDKDEMAHNDALDKKVVGDITKSIDLPDNSVDLIISRSGVEHFADTEAFIRNCKRVLRPGGRIIAVFPNKFSHFAIINQLLPQKVSRYLLYKLMPESEGILGFKAYYNKTSYWGFRKIIRENNLKINYYYPSYFSSAYYAFFVPLYLFMHFIDLLCFALGAKLFCALHLFIIEKQE